PIPKSLNSQIYNLQSAISNPLSSCLAAIKIKYSIQHRKPGASGQSKIPPCGGQTSMALLAEEV
ncbi:MAG: hypothetical protein KAI21_06950, partial [Deltaproteobacteria bacterium]|nr:hypothetical protein [Deltaproteobacteria bacterium]